MMRTTVGRNEPCPCRSGRKYKKCCLLKTSATTQPLFGQQSTQRRVAFAPPPTLPESEIASAFFPEEEEVGEHAPPADTLPVLPVEVGLRYTYPEVLGTAEVSYVFPAGLTYILADGTSIENDALAPGMQLILKDGAIATVVDVRHFYEPPDPPVRRTDGLYLSRVIGTIRHKGPMTVDVTWPGFTATSSPDHPYYSVLRRG